MDEFFNNQSLDSSLWLELELEPEPILPALTKSAFQKYEKNVEFKNKTIDVKGNTYKNMNKRIIEFSRKIRDEAMERKQADRERCYNHMISERMRRETQKHSYSSLLALLPPGTKNNKKSIVQVASSEITKLENYKEELKRRKIEIEAVLAERRGFKSKKEASSIKLRVSNPTSGINSMLAVLERLKKAGSTTLSIQSHFSDNELTATLEIIPEVDTTEVEKLLERTLNEVERKDPFYTHIR